MALKPFDFKADEYLATRTMGEIPEISDIGEDPLISQAKDTVSSMLAGKLPEAMESELRRKTAEEANLGGIVGPAARAFELRDLGVSQLDMVNQGVNFATQLEELRVQREQANRANTLERSKLKMEAQRAQDNFAIAVTESSQNQSRIALAALELQSRNRQFRIEQENRLILSNSQKAITNVQQNIDSLADAFTDFNRQAQEFIRAGI